MRSLTVASEPTPSVALRSGASASADSVARRSVRRLKITFVVRSLGYGGAERQLTVLAKAMRDRGHTVSVITFYSGGPMDQELRDAGLPVHSLEKRGRWDMVSAFIRLYRLVRKERPDVLHGYLGTPNIATTAIGAFFPSVRTVWGERASNMDLGQYGWFSRLSSIVCRALSRFPDALIVNSRAGQEHAIANGYPSEKMIVIPNGIDTDRFSPSPNARSRLREAWRVPDDVLLVGRIGRLDRMKDHPTFLHAAARIAERRPDVRFICVGDGDMGYTAEMQEIARKLGVGDRVQWLPAQADMNAVYNALDVACSSSAFGEGFPNVVAEAMACGVPCVVTDVGDSADLVAEPALTVPAGMPAKLAEALGFLLSRSPSERTRIGARARDRVRAHFSVTHLAEATERALVAFFEERQ